MDKHNEGVVSDDQLDAELKALLQDAAPAANDPIVIDMEQLDAAATAAEIKSAAYAEQDAEAAANDDAGDRSTGGVTTAKTARAPRVSRAAGAKASSVLTSVMNEETMLKAACLVEGDVEDATLVDALKTSIDGLAKKVGDKAVNLLRYQGEPKKIQGYTRFGIEFLIKNGSASSKDLTDMLQSKGYTIGTARSQANQLMSLLPTLKVAGKAGRSLTLQSDSSIVKNFTNAAMA